MVDDHVEAQQQNPSTQAGGGGEGSQQANAQANLTAFIQLMTAMMQQLQQTTQATVQALLAIQASASGKQLLPLSLIQLRL